MAVGVSAELHEGTNAPHGLALAGILDSSRSLYDQIIADEGLACEWNARGILFVYQTKHHLDAFSDTADLIRDNFGKTYEKIEGPQLEEMEPALKPGLPGGWYFRDDAHFAGPADVRAETYTC